MNRVLIIEDHAIVRRGLAQILDSEPDLEVAGEAATGAEGLRMIGAAAYDVVVLDVSLPDRSGLEVLDAAQQLRPGLRVLVLTMHSEKQYAVRAIRAGAAGYLTKESAPEALVRALRAILAGRRNITPAVAEELAIEVGGGRTGPAHERLSNRELEVLRGIVQGHAIKEMAADLELSEKTVSTYRARLLEKMGMKHNAELVRYAAEAGLFPGAV